VRAAARRLAAQDCEALAIVFINAYANPANERAALAAAREVWPNAHIACSSAILPEIREFERASTTALNAPLQPVVGSYLERLEDALAVDGFIGRFHIVQSNSGVMSTATACKLSIRTALSGPAAGVIAAAAIARAAGFPDIITGDLGGTSFGTSKAEIARRVREAADLEEIGHLLERKPRELSGGQRQRVAVCRAIVRSPKVFLFDEPLSNLDTQLRNTARTEIRALQRRLGTTTVYVTHDQVEAMTMADRIVIMKDGHVQQTGTPIEIFEKPATLFIGTFIGTPGMNVLAPAAAGAGGWTVAGNPMPPIDQAGDQIAVGVRPEDVGFEPADADPSAHVIEGVKVLRHRMPDPCGPRWPVGRR
jgi:ABC-type sugar transport system ATPase subunit